MRVHLTPYSLSCHVYSTEKPVPVTISIPRIVYDDVEQTFETPRTVMDTATRTIMVPKTVMDKKTRQIQVQTVGHRACVRGNVASHPSSLSVVSLHQK